VPRTGAGTASDGGTPLWWALLALAGVAVVGGVAGTRVLARRR